MGSESGSGDDDDDDGEDGEDGEGGGNYYYYYGYNGFNSAHTGHDHDRADNHAGDQLESSNTKSTNWLLWGSVIACSLIMLSMGACLIIWRNKKLANDKRGTFKTVSVENNEIEATKDSVAIDVVDGDDAIELNTTP